MANDQGPTRDQPALPDSHRTTLLTGLGHSNMMNLHIRNDGYMSLLSNLMFQGYGGDFSSPVPYLQNLFPELDQASLNEQDFSELLQLGDKHHVTVRALRVLEKIALDRQNEPLKEWCRDALHAEGARISSAVEWLYAIVRSLQNSGCPVSVIKSLDHWPDLGSDLDLYTSGTPEQIIR